MKFKRMFVLTLIFGIFIACSSSTDSNDDSTPETETPDPETSKLTFDGDIKSLISSKCTPCHTSGGLQRKYTLFSNPKNSVSTILSRIEQNAGSSGFMPNGGASKETDLISKIKQWQTDGLLEN